jgi:hypothetical protein
VGVFGVTKNLKTVRFLYFVEGLVFVPSAILAARWLDVEGVIAASVVVHLLVTFAASARAASKLLGSCRKVMLPMLQITVVIALGGAVAWTTFWLGLSPLTRLACSLLPVILMVALAWKNIVPQELKASLLIRIDPLLDKYCPSLRNK